MIRLFLRPSFLCFEWKRSFGKLGSVRLVDPISPEQADQSEQSIAESSDLSASPKESIAQQEEELLIPNLDISQESAQDNQSNDQVPPSNDSNTEQILPELGELRFAQDD